MRQSVLKRLGEELKIIGDKTVKVHLEKEITKQKAVLAYKKIQLVKSGQPIHEITKKLESLESEVKVNPPAINSILLEKLSSTHDGKETPVKVLDNIQKFLAAQRTYTELVERYNPGINVDSQENVRKTANHVGLSVPE